MNSVVPIPPPQVCFKREIFIQVFKFALLTSLIGYNEELKILGQLFSRCLPARSMELCSIRSFEG